MPDVEPTVALLLLLLQVPPVVVSLRVVVALMQTCAVPVISPGSGFTVTVAVTVQPVPRE